MSAFTVLLIGVVFVIVTIAGLKFHPFFALILAAILVGVLSPKPLAPPPELKDPAPAKEGPAVVETPPPAKPARPEMPQAAMAIRRATYHFGDYAGKIGVVIVLAAIVGQALMESGAADKITRRMLGVLGERRANVALLGSGYFLSIPVFFDTMFFLLVPLARALGLRTGRNFLLYIMAICAGGVVTHGLVPPTPGPLLMVRDLELDMGETIIGGFIIGLPVALAGGLFLPRLMMRWCDPPLRDAPGSSREELEAIINKKDEELPGLFVSLLPVLLPVVLITLHSVVSAILQKYTDVPLDQADAGAIDLWSSIWKVTAFTGDVTFALGLGTVISLWVLQRARGYDMRKLAFVLEPAIASAGTIILITCAGGAFGKMLAATGLVDEIRGWVGGEGGQGTMIILIAWGISAVLKIAQGSGTVAMSTTSGIMAGIILTPGFELGYHKIYVFAAIAFGSKSISWMNDSGFWVVCKMSGYTEKETLKTWTVLLAFMSVLGLVEVLILSRLLPLI